MGPGTVLKSGEFPGYAIAPTKGTMLSLGSDWPLGESPAWMPLPRYLPES